MRATNGSAGRGWSALVLILASSTLATATYATKIVPGRRAATTWYVDDDTCPEVGDGSVASPFCSIQDGIDAASNGDEVVVAPGTYVHFGDLRGKEIVLHSSGGRDVTMIEAGASCTSGETAATIIDGFTFANIYQAMQVSSSSPTIRNCAFVNLGGDGVQGAGISLTDSSSVISDCEFIGNRSERAYYDGGFSGGGTISGAGGYSGGRGAGIYSSASNAVVERCEFRDNYVTGPAENRGAAIFASGAITVTDCVFESNCGEFGGATYGVSVDRCRFLNNMAHYGGAMYGGSVLDSEFVGNAATEGGAYYGSLGTDLRSSVFRQNKASTGGAVYHAGTDVGTVSGCRFLGNSASGSGGAIFMRQGALPLEVVNSSFVGNTAREGSVAYVDRNSSIIINSTLVANEAVQSGGAFDGQLASIDVINSILWANQPARAVSYADVSYSIVDAAYSGTGVISADPMFLRMPDPKANGWDGVDDDYGELLLLTSSPAIDAGSNSAVPNDVTEDLGGFPRFADIQSVPDTGEGTAPIVDMGAYEAGVCNITGSADCNGNGIWDECEPDTDCNMNGIPDICDLAAGSSEDCDGDLVPDECEPGGTEDCTNNGVSDVCDLFNGTAFDCNENGVPDSCDIASGTSLDDNSDGLPDECCVPPAAPLAELQPIAKNRYLTMRPDPSWAGRQIALRVNPLELPGLEYYEYVPLWVGPLGDYPDENAAHPGQTFRVARLQCDPYYHDWSGESEFQVTGAEIIPWGRYKVQAVEAGCNLSFASSYSDPLAFTNAKFGDIVEPFDGEGSTQPDFGDVTALIDKFLAAPTSPPKARAQLQPSVIRPSRPVDFGDIYVVLQAFLGARYVDTRTGYDGRPEGCTCPSAVTCGATACISNGSCSGGVCLDGFCTDACGRCTP